MAGRKKGAKIVDETDSQKFIRLANQRVSMALKYISLVGNLAGPGYQRTVEQVEQIVTTLQGAVDTTKDRFGGKTPSASGFRLGDD